MKCKIIVFGVFLSVFILLLVPSVSCVNANIQNENNLNIKNIDIDDIKTIRNKLKDSECNCQKTADNINSKSQEPKLLCDLLLLIYGIIYSLCMEVPSLIIKILLSSISTSILVFGFYILRCEWYFPSFNKLFANNEEFLYDLVKFSYLGLGDIYEK